MHGQDKPVSDKCDNATMTRAKENDKEVDKGHLTLIGSYHSKQLLDKNLSFFLIEMDILLKEKNIVITIDK